MIMLMNILLIYFSRTHSCSCKRKLYQDCVMFSHLVHIMYYWGSNYFLRQKDKEKNNDVNMLMFFPFGKVSLQKKQKKKIIILWNFNLHFGNMTVLKFKQAVTLSHSLLLFLTLSHSFSLFLTLSHSLSPNLSFQLWLSTDVRVDWDHLQRRDGRLQYARHEELLRGPSIAQQLHKGWKKTSVLHVSNNYRKVLSAKLRCLYRIAEDYLKWIYRKFDIEKMSSWGTFGWVWKDLTSHAKYFFFSL